MKAKKCQVKQNPNSTDKARLEALKKIAMMGYGMKEDVEGPGEEDGPWAPGWEDRNKKVQARK